MIHTITNTSTFNIPLTYSGFICTEFNFLINAVLSGLQLTHAANTTQIFLSLSLIQTVFLTNDVLNFESTSKRRLEDQQLC